MNYPVGTVLVHPDDFLHDPDARRIILRAVTPGEWPWMRLTGLPAGLPRQGGDLDGWQPQRLGDLGLLLGHKTILAGHEVQPPTPRSIP